MTRIKSITLTLVLLFQAAVIVNADADENTTFNDEYSRAMRALESGDYQRATQIFTRLAKQNRHIQSQTALGIKYDKGLGVPQSYQKAFKLFRAAAEQNDPIAQYHLGVKYVNGHGVPQNPFQAYIWFAIAFNNGNELAADPLRVLNQSLSTVERQKALKLVVKKMEDLGK